MSIRASVLSSTNATSPTAKNNCAKRWTQSLQLCLPNSNQFQSTKLNSAKYNCLTKYFMKGYCRNDEQCPFAHGPADLHNMIIISKAPIKPDYGQAGQFLFSILRNL